MSILRLQVSLGQKSFHVPPAYGDISLALVMHSNEGGPGPRYNMKEDPGSPILSLLVVQKYYLYLLPFFSEPGDWKNQCGPLPPSLRPTWAKPPPPPPWGTYSVEGRVYFGVIQTVDS